MGSILRTATMTFHLPAHRRRSSLQTFGDLSNRRTGSHPSIERVSILLGHQSVRITEKHYALWVRSRQEQLEADLANAWSRDPLVLLQSGVHQRYTERSGPTTRSSSITKTGARGGSRTHMRKNPRRILSPQRLPFRHPGAGTTNLAETNTYCNLLHRFPSACCPAAFSSANRV